MTARQLFRLVFTTAGRLFNIAPKCRYACMYLAAGDYEKQYSLYELKQLGEI